nr:hypothetical protein [Tanacetum cinerariifolium]
MYGYDGLPMQPVAPPSLDYITSPKEPQTPPVPQDEDKREPMFIQPHDPDYVPELMYPEYTPLEDGHVLLTEEQPLPPVDSPTAESLGYVAESDLQEDPKEYKDDESEDGLVDYLIDGGDDVDDDEGDLSKDDADDEDEDEEEEMRLASVDFTVVVPTVEPVSPPERADPASISLPPEAEVERLLAMPTPSPSPPSAGERLANCMASSAHSSPPHVPSLLLPLSGCLTQIQTLRITSTQALIDTVTTTLPSPSLPPLPPPLYIPPPVNHRDDILKTELPPRKKSCLFALGPMYEVRESSTARPTEGRGIDYGFVSTLNAKARRRRIREVGYGIRDTWVDPTEAVPEIAPMTLGEVNTKVTKLAELHEHDTQDLYALLENAQDSVCTRVPDPGTSDTATAAGRIMAPVTRRGPNTPPNNINPNNMTPKSIQAMIDQALLQNSTNEDGSHRTEGVVGLTRWIKKMELVFNISGCTIDNQEVLRKKMTDNYCPQGEIKKLEIELWNLKVKGNDVSTHTERFQELNLICTKFVANETKKIDKYISGLPNNIYGSVKASKPKTLDETIKLANDLMDQKLRTYAERQTDNKRKADDSSRNNHGHQQHPSKRQNVAKVYTMGSGERKPYGGNFPKCTKCYFHHNGLCTQKCHKCNKVGHLARDCKSSVNTNVANTQRDNRAIPKGNGCFKCGALGHFKRDCPKLKNKDRGNVNAQGWVYAVGNAEKKENASRDPDSNVIMGENGPNLRGNGCFECRNPGHFKRDCPKLKNKDGGNGNAQGWVYDVGNAERNGNVARNSDSNVVTGTFLLNNRYASQMSSRYGLVEETSRVQEYRAKGCHVFLAQISATKEDDKSEGKQVRDVPIVQDFPKVFPEDLPGLPPARPVEFQIALILGAAPVVRAPYRLAPSEMKELSEQLQELFDKAEVYM